MNELKKIITITITIYLFSIYTVYAQNNLRTPWVRLDNNVRHFYTEGDSMVIKAQGKINANGSKIGTWLYYNKNGTLSGKAHFSKKGHKKGLWVYYNKQIKIRICPQNGILYAKKSSAKKIPLKEIKEPIELPNNIQYFEN